MADNINLIPAAELPLTEAEAVDVLCVEGGELKRKAAANLGGGGGGYVIHVPAEEFTVDDTTDPTSVTITLSESYDNFAPLWYSGGNLYLDATNDPTLAGAGAIIYLPIMAVAFAPELGGFVMMATNALTQVAYQIIAGNGTWTPATTAESGENET